jgi:hypothetical protein
VERRRQRQMCIRDSNTTYESIYKDKTNIDTLCSALNIEEAIWLDILDSRHRLQNGKLGMERYKAKEGKSKLI